MRSRPSLPLTPKAGEAVDHHRRPKIGRAMDACGVPEWNGHVCEAPLLAGNSATESHPARIRAEMMWCLLQRLTELKGLDCDGMDYQEYPRHPRDTRLRGWLKSFCAD
jgi:hypothetical protein